MTHEEKQDKANEICNYFFQNCGAVISKKDYDAVNSILSEVVPEEKLKKYTYSDGLEEMLLSIIDEEKPEAIFVHKTIYNYMFGERDGYRFCGVPIKIINNFDIVEKKKP